MNLEEIKMAPLRGCIINNIFNDIKIIETRWLEMIDVRTKLLAMITHDLRAPIARMKVRIETSDFFDALEFIDDLNELNNLINDTLIYAKENQLSQEKFKKTNILTLLELVIEKYQSLGKDIQLYYTPSTYHANVRQLLLKRAFTNIIVNGFKYGNKIKIDLDLSKDNRWIEITFIDNGMGAPEEELAYLTDPFYQAKNSCSGNGLGFAIVHEVIKNHNGHLKISNADVGGMQVNIILPRA